MFIRFGFNCDDVIEYIQTSHKKFSQKENALNEAETVSDKPCAIIAKTIKGKDVSFMENAVGWHGSAPNDEQHAQAIAELKAKLETLM